MPGHEIIDRGCVAEEIEWDGGELQGASPGDEEHCKSVGDVEDGAKTAPDVGHLFLLRNGAMRLFDHGEAGAFPVEELTRGGFHTLVREA
jgi:hypothetical protein